VEATQKDSECDIVMAFKRFTSSSSKRVESPVEITGDYDDHANSEINVRRETPIE